jgi:hypothetical protein
MAGKTIRKELHQAIDNIDDEQFLKAIYTILAEKLSEYNYSLSLEQDKEVDRRIEAHKKGESKSYSWTQAKKSIKAKLKK